MSEVKVHLKVSRRGLGIGGAPVRSDGQGLVLDPAVALLVLQGKVRPPSFRAADELIDSLTLTYNKARQEGITNELMDIIGGSVAVE